MRLITIRLAVLSLFLVVLQGRVEAQSFEDGFTFFLPPDDSAAAPFLPTFPALPISESDHITAQGEQFFRGDDPIRFFGANLVANGAFPAQAEAGYVAGRMRKMGFNLVRFHHIDNNWTRNIFADGTTRQLDPSALDDLEYLVSRLKEEGIYVNMNLHVSRTFTAADGVAGADSIRDYGKGVTLFDRELIDLQKEYATQLLTHVNPHTGMQLSKDPVLAMVEITNENSLYYMWRQGALRPFSEGGNLMVRHVAMLDDLWQEFLRERYGSDAALLEAWSAGAMDEGEERIINGGFESPLGNPWELEWHAGTQAVVERDGAEAYAGDFSARVDVAQTGANAWNVQWKQTGLTIEEDSTYSVAFALRAETERSISVSIQKDVDPWDVFAGFTAEVSPEWKTYRFSFTAPSTSTSDVRLSFTVGGEEGSVWVDDVSMRRSGRIGLEDAESLDEGTVRRIDASDLLSYSDARVRDMTAFYIQLQDDYFAEMSAFLKDDLGVSAPITGTNWNFGLVDLAVQSKLDYIDNHAYWDHPNFPNAAWSPTDWTISNTPMVRSPESSTIPRLMAGVPVAGKPYTISEYNHAFPNRYQTEGILFLTAYSAFHGVDGLMFFEYSAGTDWTSDRIDGFFSIHRNTAMMALVPSAARAYREGLIAPAATTLTANYSADDVLRYPALDQGAWEGVSLFPRTLALEHRVVAGSFDEATPTDLSSFPDAPAGPYTTDTGEITWNADGLMKVAAPRFEAATGFFDDFVGETIGHTIITDGSGFGTLTWLSLSDDELQTSRRSLLTLSSMAQNRGMVWTGTSTVRDRWGAGPVEVRPLRVTLMLDVEADSLRLHALDESGESRGYAHIAPDASGHFEVVLDQFVDETVWFGLEAFGDGTSVGLSSPEELRLSLAPIYPNPTFGTAHVSFSIPRAGEVRLSMFDVLGRLVQSDMVSADAGKNEVEVDVTPLAPGLYILQLESGDRSLVRTLLVQ